MSEAKKVIVIDDEPDICRAVAQTLTLHHYQVDWFTSAEKVLPLLNTQWDGVIIADINMPNMDGLEFLIKAFEIDAQLAIILLTGHGDISLAVESMRKGAYDFLEKPFATDTFIDSVKRAQDHRNLVLENRRLREELDAQSGPGPRVLGNHPKIKELRRTLTRVKDTPANVMIMGETGVGKELVARFLHDHSKRAKGPFVVLDCGAIPDELMDRELFGDYKLNPPPNKHSPSGKIVAADRGTLLLDNIENLSPGAQMKFLRFLEEKQLRSIGSNECMAVDVRVLSSSTSDIQALVDQGQFRADLYYRLNVIHVRVPPLRERVEDISLLFENFLRLASSRYQIRAPRPTLNQKAWLQTHTWPGNIRELRNVAERFVLTGDHSVFGAGESDSDLSLNLSMAEQVNRFEKTLIHDALKRCAGRLKSVHAQLNIPRKTLYEKMQKYGLDKNDYKNDL
ncbi:MAG: sigma-54 dependent transcriptional regulator [Cellvibrionaceae bacterium]|nr:sigma-54 dependent transcriptional regulator [Cellvibrionaceae bacterium]